MPFRTNYRAGQPHKLLGSLINREHAVLHAVSAEREASHTASRFFGHVNAENPHAPTIIGVAKIIDAADTCGDSSDVGEEVAVPCSSKDLYLARFRYYDSVNEQWAEYEEDLRLDASAYYEDDPTDASKTPVSEYPDTRAGSIPSYAIGDVTAAYWDQVRNMLVPIQSPYQDIVSAEFISHNTQAFPQAGQSQQTPFDSWAECYLEVKQPNDQDWKALSVLSWRIPYIDSLREYRDSRAGFCFFAAPHGTLVRLRMLASSDFVQSATNWSQIQFFGAGRSNILADFVPHTVFSRGGGVLRQGHVLRADTVGRFKDSPEFITAQGDVFEVTHEDPLDEWIIGCQFSVVLYNELGQRNLTALSIDVVTRIDCEEGKILEWCKRTITFPAELGNLIGVSAEECTQCEELSTSCAGQFFDVSASSVSSASTASSISTASSMMSSQSTLSSVSSSTLSSSTLSSASTLSSLSTSQSTASSLSSLSSSTQSSASSVSSISSSTLSSSSVSSQSTSSISSMSSLSTASSLSSSSMSSSTASSLSSLSSSSISTASSVSTASSQSLLSASSLSSLSSVSSTTSLSTMSSSTISSESSASTLSSSSLSSISTLSSSSVSTLSSSSPSSQSTLSSSSRSSMSSSSPSSISTLSSSSVSSVSSLSSSSFSSLSSSSPSSVSSLSSSSPSSVSSLSSSSPSSVSSLSSSSPSSVSSLSSSSLSSLSSSSPSSISTLSSSSPSSFSSSSPSSLSTESSMSSSSSQSTQILPSSQSSISTLSSSSMSSLSSLSSSSPSSPSSLSSSSLSSLSTLSSSSVSTLSSSSPSSISTLSSSSISTLSSSSPSSISTLSTSSISTESSQSSVSSISSSSVSTLSSSSPSTLSTLTSQSSESSGDCCETQGDCSWTWDADLEVWNLTDTCTESCQPAEICKCINGPTRDGLFDGEVWVGNCVHDSFP